MKDFFLVLFLCRGLIDQFESINIDPKKACDMVAEDLVKKGLFEDAIKLFDLAKVRKISFYFIFTNFN